MARSSFHWFAAQVGRVETRHWHTEDPNKQTHLCRNPIPLLLRPWSLAGFPILIRIPCPVPPVRLPGLDPDHRALGQNLSHPGSRASYHRPIAMFSSPVAGRNRPYSTAMLEHHWQAVPEKIPTPYRESASTVTHRPSEHTRRIASARQETTPDPCGQTFR